MCFGKEVWVKMFSQRKEVIYFIWSGETTKTHDMEGFAIEEADNFFILILLYSDPIWTLNYDIEGSASSMAVVNLKPRQLSIAVDADSSF